MQKCDRELYSTPKRQLGDKPDRSILHVLLAREGEQRDGPFVHEGILFIYELSYNQIKRTSCHWVNTALELNAEDSIIILITWNSILKMSPFNMVIT